jgi:hypothetical protein
MIAQDLAAPAAAAAGVDAPEPEPRTGELFVHFLGGRHIVNRCLTHVDTGERYIVTWAETRGEYELHKLVDFLRGEVLVNGRPTPRFRKVL